MIFNFNIDLNTVILVSSAITGLVGAIFAAFKFHQKVVKPALNGLSTLVDSIQTIEQIKKELLPNGGSSVKDALNRIELKLQILESQRKAILNLHKEIFIEFDANFNLKWASNSFYIFTKKTEGDMKNLGWLNIVAKKDISQVHSNVLYSSIDNRSLDLTYHISIDGEEKKIQQKCSPIFSPNTNQIIGYIAQIKECN